MDTYPRIAWLGNEAARLLINATGNYHPVMVHCDRATYETHFPESRTQGFGDGALVLLECPPFILHVTVKEAGEWLHTTLMARCIEYWEAQQEAAVV